MRPAHVRFLSSVVANGNPSSLRRALPRARFPADAARVKKRIPVFLYGGAGEGSLILAASDEPCRLGIWESLGKGVTMRLTLRTLLAYMDDLLEPQDAIQMGKRIEENKVATELVHRIRTRMRLLRLGAPKVDGKGLGADANSVAEYLDNSLAVERVPDFEKLCLESDVHLAEAASCHQILAAVLDKPAVVDPALRLRVYNLIARADDFGEASGAESYHPEMDFGDLATATATAFPPSSTAKADRVGLPPAAGVARPTVAPKKTISRQAVLALTIALVLLLVLGGLRAVGPFDGRHPLAGMLGLSVPSGTPENLVAMGDGSADGGSAEDAAGNAAGNADQLASGDSNDSAAAANGLAPSTAGSAADNPDGAAGGPGTAGAANEVAADGATVNSATVNGAAANGAAASDGAGPRATTVGGAVGGANANAPVAATAGGTTPPLDTLAAGRASASGRSGLPAVGNDELVEEAAKAGGGRLGGAGRAGAGGAGAGRAGGGGLGGIAQDRGDAADGADRTASEAMEMGRLLSEEHVVARRNADDNLWYRLPRGAAIAAGDHLVSLPVFRPQFILSTGVQFMVAGESSLRIGAADGGQTPVLALESGRLLIATSGRPGAGVLLNLGGQAGSLRFVDADAEAAIEVRREFVPGEDPMVVSAPTTIRIAVRRGKVSWTDPMQGGRGETMLGSGMLASFSPGGDMELSDQPFPSWSSPQPNGGLERSAAEQLAGLVKIDRPLTLSLTELTQFRKTEVRSLAARCLGALGEYRALWNELSDERQYSYWDEALDAQRAAIVRSAQDALDVRRSAEQLMKQEIPLLMQLLRGFDPSQLENGGAAELVDALDHADLDVRVLAFENLRRITGATHNFRPEKPAEARKASLMEWRRQLKDGRIVYRQRSADAE